MVSMPKMKRSNLENIRHLSFQNEALSESQDAVKTNDTIEWLRNFTDLDVDECFVELLKNLNE
jgi:hypothetical protein